jgi:sugar (pentulose or hexulose) kinase
LGAFTKEWATRTGLPQDVFVYCGIHDSNAALLAARSHHELREGDLTVLSTGTWFVAMRSLAQGAPFSSAVLPLGRDVLVNVDVQGRPVPSARFMGGREIHLLTALASRQIDIPADQPAILGAAAEVISKDIKAIPTLVPGCGPYPTANGGWTAKPNDPLQLRAAVSLYAALMSDAMIELIGARRNLLIEGRFAGAVLFVRALATLRPDLKVYTALSNTDVAQGALKLVCPGETLKNLLHEVAPLDVDLAAYRTSWRACAEKAATAPLKPVAGRQVEMSRAMPSSPAYRRPSAG